MATVSTAPPTSRNERKKTLSRTVRKCRTCGTEATTAWMNGPLETRNRCAQCNNIRDRLNSKTKAKPDDQVSSASTATMSNDHTASKPDDKTLTTPDNLHSSQEDTASTPDDKVNFSALAKLRSRAAKVSVTGKRTADTPAEKPNGRKKRRQQKKKDDDEDPGPRPESSGLCGWDALDLWNQHENGNQGRFEASEDDKKLFSLLDAELLRGSKPTKSVACMS